MQNMQDEHEEQMEKQKDNKLGPVLKKLKRENKNQMKEIVALKRVVKQMKKENVRIIVDGDDDRIESLEERLLKANRNHAAKETENSLLTKRFEKLERQ